MRRVRFGLRLGVHALLAFALAMQALLPFAAARAAASGVDFVTIWCGDQSNEAVDALEGVQALQAILHHQSQHNAADEAPECNTCCTVAAGDPPHSDFQGAGVSPERAATAARAGFAVIYPVRGPPLGAQAPPYLTI